MQGLDLAAAAQPRRSASQRVGTLFSTIDQTQPTSQVRSAQARVLGSMKSVKELDMGKAPSENPLEGQFQINFIEIENEPAQAYVFRPQDSNTYFVWVEKKS